MMEADRRFDAGAGSHEAGDPGDPSPGKHRGFWRFWGSLPGLLTAIATLITAIAALAALFVQQKQELDERTEALQQATSQPTPTVTVTATVTGAPATLPTTPTGSDPTGTDPSSDPELPFGSRYLSELDPVDWSGSFSAESAVLSNRPYPRSVLLWCNEGYVIYNTSGSSQLTAQLGVADNASAANGAIGDISFYDQDDRKLGTTVAVSLGHPTRVTLDLGGAVQTKITCAGRDRVTDEVRHFYVTLGDAALVP